MSKQYDNTNSGTLFKNDMEGKSENFPPYGGSTEQTCPHCSQSFMSWVSAWVKDGQKGKFFSLAFKPKEARQERATPARQEPAMADDDIPF
jgi:hypothetical protein